MPVGFPARFGTWGALVASLVVSGALHAQEQRFELGLRVVALESQWLATQMVERHQAALPIVTNAVRAFFTLQPKAACRLLDEARRVLLHEKPHFSDSLAVRPSTFLVTHEIPTLEFMIEDYYPLEIPETPDSPPHFLDIQWDSNKTSTVRIVKHRPQRFVLPTANWQDGDQELHFIFREGETRRRQFSYTIAVVRDLPARRARLLLLLSHLDEHTKTLEDPDRKDVARQLTTSTHGVLKLAKLLDQNGVPEQRVKLHHFLTEAEASLVEFMEGSAWTRIQRPGDHWIHLQLSEITTAVRVQVPDTPLGVSKAWPVVVALHGAGGNEHLFFESYGAGLLPKLCEQKQWLLVAPRIPMMSRLDLAELLEALDTLYPLHPEQCFVVGHSHGAMVAVNEVSFAPDKVRALALMSGGGLPRQNPKPLFSIPIFVAAGDHDFGKPEARRLFERLEQLGHPRVRYEEISNAEHLMVVTEALPKVVEFFQQSLQQQKAQ